MMKRLLVFILLLSSVHIFSQDITGIWRGYFYADNGFFKEYYKYEVQIDQLKNNSLKGVTYSYRTTVFYGKANFDGIWFPKAKSLLVKETNLVELKMADNTQACAMTCNLDYSSDGKTETLKGTFTSINTTSKSDCGSGTVYLERVQESDFTKEDFLLKKKPAPIPSTQNKKPAIDSIKNKSTISVSKTNAKKIQAALGVPQDGIIGPKSTAEIKRRAPDFNEKLDLNNTAAVNKLINLIKKNNTATVKKNPSVNTPNQNKKLPPPIVKKDTIAKSTPVTTQPEQPEIKNLPPKKIIPVPEVIKERSNPLIKTITTAAQDIKVELYDNGEIDGDTITVYDNNEVIAWKKGLSDKPITLNLKADPNTPVHEFVMV
ncbi:MAG TPA: hypothetical protein VGI61_07150, partial [Parafilimonas sp.]